MNRDEAIAETKKHISNVKKLLSKVAEELKRRGEQHDASKLDPMEIDTFIEFAPKLHNTTYGSEEYKNCLKAIKPALDHHYKNNRHHPDHFENGINSMNLVDIMEMFCDWLAATKRHADGDIVKSIEINQDRYNISPQLVAILKNTVEFLTAQGDTMKSTLVAGGAGFLGSHFCDFLLAKKHKVYCVDNLITGNLDNLQHLLDNPDFKFMECDIEEFSSDETFDNIIDFASPASPIDYLKHPVKTLLAGSAGVHRLLEIASLTGARFLLASTSECYGDPLVHPQPETYFGNVDTMSPRAVYDEAKRFAEAITMAYHRKYDLDTRIVRIFNTYGPRMQLNDGRALPAFMCQALRGEDLTVFGDGSQTRSFCYVSDQVKGIYKLLKSKEIYPVNIGNNEEVSILNFAKEIIALTKSKSKIVFKDLPHGDPKVRRPDISKAKSVLGWKPRIKRAEGLAVTLKYFKEKVVSPQI